jgi:hypothetical protein
VAVCHFIFVVFVGTVMMRMEVNGGRIVLETMMLLMMMVMLRMMRKRRMVVPDIEHA